MECAFPKVETEFNEIIELTLKIEYSLFIQILNKKTINIKVEPFSKILKIKMDICKKVGIPLDKQKLFFDNKELNDSQTLENYDIKNLSTLKLNIVQNELEKNELFIKDLIGKSYVIPFNFSDTIKDLKEKIKEKVKIPINSQKLFFFGKELDNDSFCYEYDIKNKSTLNLIIIYKDFIIIDIYNEKKNFIKEITFEKKKNSTVLDIKNFIKEKENIQVYNQKLIFNDEILEDNKYISEYNIQNGNKIKLIQICFIIIFKTITGGNLIIEANPSDKISEIMEEIFYRTNFPPSKQTLIFAGKRLEDYETLYRYNIQKESIINLLLSKSFEYIKCLQFKIKYNNEEFFIKLEDIYSDSNIILNIQNEIKKKKKF